VPFKDSAARTWNVALDAPTIRVIRKECSIDPITGESYERMHDDPLLLADVLAVCCRDQIQAVGGLTEDQFKASVKGDAIDSGLAAILEAQLDFCRSGQRETLRASAAKMASIREKATAMHLERINSPEFEANILAALNTRMDAATEEAMTLLSSVTKLPEPSESVPEVTPSES